MVFGVGRDDAGLGVLLNACNDVFKAFASGYGPIACTVFVAHIGCPFPFKFFRNVGRSDGRHGIQVGEFERSRTVCHVGIGEEHHRCSVFQCHACGFVGRIEAVGGAACSDDGHGAFAVASEECLQEVGLFALGGESGCRASALYIEHHKRKLKDDRQIHGLALQTESGTRGTGDAQGSGKRCTDGGAASCDFVLTLYGGDAQGFVFREFVEDIRGRRDGI